MTWAQSCLELHTYWTLTAYWMGAQIIVAIFSSEMLILFAQILILFLDRSMSTCACYPKESPTVDPWLTDGLTYRRLDLQTFWVTDFSGRKIWVWLADWDLTYRPEKNQNGTKTACYRINWFSMHCRSMETWPTDFFTWEPPSNTD